VYILQCASHSTREQLWNGKIIRLEPGQFISGRRKLAAETGINEHKIDRGLKLFKTEQQIEQQVSHTSRLITIVKWNDYQGNEPQLEPRMSHERATDEPLMSTIQERKNIKNDKNERSSGGGDKSPTPSQTMKDFILMVNIKNQSYINFCNSIAISKKLTVEIVQRELDKFVNYWCEKNKTGTKERWEMEKVFEVQRRLATWLSRMQTSGTQRKGITFIS